MKNAYELSPKEQADRLDYQPKAAPHRTALKVPFAEKDRAKALGAKWDGQVKQWYIEADMDMKKFRQWL